MVFVLSMEACCDLCLVLGGLPLVYLYTLCLHSRGTHYAFSRCNKYLVCCRRVMYYMVLHLSFGLGFLEKDMIKP